MQGRVRCSHTKISRTFCFMSVSSIELRLQLQNPWHVLRCSNSSEQTRRNSSVFFYFIFSLPQIEYTTSPIQPLIFKNIFRSIICTELGINVKKIECWSHSPFQNQSQQGSQSGLNSRNLLWPTRSVSVLQDEPSGEGGVLFIFNGSSSISPISC